jgi:hypothetical protein
MNGREVVVPGKGPKIGRLALRVEGDMWCAYFAQDGTMNGAILVGSIKIGAVEASEVRKQDFISLMQGCISDAIQHGVGSRPTWDAPKEPGRGAH